MLKKNLISALKARHFQLYGFSAPLPVVKHWGKQDVFFLDAEVTSFDGALRELGPAPVKMTTR